MVSSCVWKAPPSESTNTPYRLVKKKGPPAPPWTPAATVAPVFRRIPKPESPNSSPLIPQIFSFRSQAIPLGEKEGTARTALDPCRHRGAGVPENSQAGVSQLQPLDPPDIFILIVDQRRAAAAPLPLAATASAAGKVVPQDQKSLPAGILHLHREWRPTGHDDLHLRRTDG